MIRFKAILLLALFTFSAFGNTFEVHYCEGEITDIAIFGSANCVCEHEVAVETECCDIKHSSCCAPAETSKHENDFEDKSCCESEFAQVITTAEFQKTTSTIQLAWLANALFKPSFFAAQRVDNYSVFVYNDPESWIDIPIKLQRFLI